MRPEIRRPVFLKIIFFYAALLTRQFIHIASGNNKQWIWHTTGTSHVFSTFIHLQFIHASWKEHKGQNKENFFLRAYRSSLEKFNIFMEKICFREGKIYMAISQSVADDLKKYYGIRDNVYVVHHGVDPLKFFPLSEVNKKESPIRKHLNIPDGSVVGILVGSYERKGLEASIRAIALLKENIKNLNLIAVGDGNLTYFSELIRSLNLEQVVKLVSKQKNILDYYQAADFFLLPTQYEPFGLVITEALACGLPAVVSRCAGGSELITDDVEGFLINDPYDPVEISKHLNKLLSSNELLKKMSQNARLLAEKRSWDQVAKEFEIIFNRHLG